MFRMTDAVGEKVSELISSNSGNTNNSGNYTKLQILISITY